MKYDYPIGVRALPARTIAKDWSYLLPKFSVFGIQTFAVATPWSIKLNQHIFFIIIHNVLKCLCYHNLL